MSPQPHWKEAYEQEQRKRWFWFTAFWLSVGVLINVLVSVFFSDCR